MNTTFWEESHSPCPPPIPEFENPAEKIRCDPFTLVFSCKATEASFRNDYCTRNVGHVRVAMCVFFVCFSFINVCMLAIMWNNGGVDIKSASIPFIISCLMLLNVSFTFTPRYEEFMQASVAGMTSLLGIQLVIIAPIVPKRFLPYHLYNLGLGFALHGPLLKLRFIYGAAMCICCFILCEVLLIDVARPQAESLYYRVFPFLQKQDTPGGVLDVEMLGIITLELLVTVVLGLCTSYMTERGARQAYLLMSALQQMWQRSDFQLQQAVDREDRLFALMDAAADAMVPQEKSGVSVPGQQIRRLLDRRRQEPEPPKTQMRDTVRPRRTSNMTRAHSMGDFTSSSNLFQTVPDLSKMKFS